MAPQQPLACPQPDPRRDHRSTGGRGDPFVFNYVGAWCEDLATMAGGPVMQSQYQPQPQSYGAAPPMVRQAVMQSNQQAAVQPQQIQFSYSQHGAVSISQSRPYPQSRDRPQSNYGLYPPAPMPPQSGVYAPPRMAPHKAKATRPANGGGSASLSQDPWPPRPAVQFR